MSIEMDSVEAANRFVNCVMNRYRSDTVMRIGGTILILISPFLALLFGYMSLNGSDPKVEDYLVWTCIGFFFFILSLSMFMIYRRLVDHSVRDREWRDALTEYAVSKGCDVAYLKDISRKAKSKESTIAEGPAILLLIVMFLVIVLVGGNPNMFGITETDGSRLMAIIIVGMLVAFLMMLFVLLYVLTFPYKHESTQIDFTAELCRVLSERGVTMIEMRQTVNHKSIVLGIILFIITGGLWSIVMLYRTYSDANIHVQNQWSYESRVMELIIEAEHGTGIAAGTAEGKK